MKQNKDCTRTYIHNHVAYIVRNCTAVAARDLDKPENMRQNALFVGCHMDWEYVENVVFGHPMPESDGEFAEMCEDSAAWESEYNVIRSVRFITRTEDMKASA